MPSGQILTETETEILFNIATKGLKTYKQLFDEKIANSNKTILYSLKHLEYMSLINGAIGKNEGQSSRGRKATYYNLTPVGLIIVLFYRWEKIDKNDPKKNLKDISIHWGKLMPLIFGKWDFYINQNLFETAFYRLYASILSYGPTLEQYIKLRRLQMKSDLQREKQSRQILEELKQFLTKSELKGFPKNPVYMTEKEREKQFRAFLKMFGVTEQDELINAGKIIDEGAYEITSKNITETFFFGSNRVRIDPEKETEFLKKIVKDKDLHKYISDWILETEKIYIEYLENIRSWKNLLTEK